MYPGDGQAHLEPDSPIFRPTASLLARHAAPSDDGKLGCARCRRWRGARRAARIWGVLRGDVDNFGLRLRRVNSIEEHVQLSVLYKQFFAGELEVLCSMPEFWRKVSILYSGGDDFAVYGGWDALIALAREVQRLFHRFTEENLEGVPGAGRQDHLHGDGAGAGDRTIRWPRCTRMPGAIWTWPNRRTRIASICWAASSNGSNLADAADLKDTVTRLVHDFRMSRQFLYQSAQFLSARSLCGERRGQAEAQRTWRFQRRFNRILSGTRDREFQKLRTHLINEIDGPEIGRSEAAARRAGGPGVGQIGDSRFRQPWPEQSKEAMRTAQSREATPAARRCAAAARAVARRRVAAIAADRPDDRGDRRASAATAGAPKARPKSSSKS